MLEGIFQIGEYLNSSDEEDIIDSIIENPNDNGNYKYVLKIIYKITGENAVYNRTECEKFTVEKLRKYAYKKGSPNGGDFSPTSKLTEPEKTIDRIKKSIKTILLIADNESQEKKILSQIYESLEKEKQIIVNSLKNMSVKTEKNDAFVVTIVTETEDSLNSKYPGEMVIVKDFLAKAYDEQYFNKYKKTSKGLGTCYFCKQHKEVFGFVNTYNFYTVDKKGFVSGGFNQESAWKNYPVCSKCAHTLERGRRYIDKNLTSHFSGFDYSIIPQIIFNDAEDKESINDILENFENGKKFSMSKDESDSLLSSEDRFIDTMAESSNQMNYNMVIFKEEQSGNVYRILLYIEDIIPSKLKSMLRVKNDIDLIELFRNLEYFNKKTNKTEKFDMRFNFGLIREFLPNTKKEGNFDKTFLEILNNIFTFKKTSYKFLLNIFMKKIQQKFSNDESIDFTVLKALMSIMFLDRLALFSYKEKGSDNIVVEITDSNKKYIEFLQKYDEILEIPYKKAVFLEGVLVSKLLSVQYVRMKSKPFYSKINGLKLNEKLIHRIFTEAINKLNEYDENYYFALEELIAFYMLNKPIPKLSDDEISYYFALGMSLSRYFKEEKKEGQNNANNSEVLNEMEEVEND